MVNDRGDGVGYVWMSLPEAARYLDVSPSTLRHWCKSRQITHHYIAGRYRFQRADLDAFVYGTTIGERGVG